MKYLVIAPVGLLMIPFVLLGIICHAIAGAFAQGAIMWGAFVDWSRE